MAKILRFIYFSIKKRSAKRMFLKNSVFGKNTVFGHMAKCYNDFSSNSITIGDSCDIQCTIISKHNGKVIIGNNTTIRYNSTIGAINSIDIGNYVIISNNVSIYDNNNHPTSPKLRKEMSLSGFYSEKWDWINSVSSSIVIKDNVWIGEKSMILKGVTIGEGSIIAAGSVVSKDVPPYVIVAGNPARVVKELMNDNIL